MDREIVLLDDDAGPHLAHQFVLGDELAVAAHQRQQHIERALSDHHRNVARQQLVPVGQQTKRSEGEMSVARIVRIPCHRHENAARASASLAKTGASASKRAIRRTLATWFSGQTMTSLPPLSAQILAPTSNSRMP